ncbi:MAG: pyridoxamine 5'-phosphate oxidase family protein [Methanomassiliicoccaceae archaeon]|nr:pyridoxamine 5'-phosphate oxidase family protein [Methanomassiliicoccaceae archaeon]
MEKKKMFEVMAKNPVFFLATADGNEPRVRGMMLYKADDDGIYFHTGPFKDVHKQMVKNPNVQLCFFDAAEGIQVRVRGKVEIINDDKLKEEISNHPSRGFMQSWKEGKTKQEFLDFFSVFRLRNGIANVWTFQSNFAPKEDIRL